MPRIFFQSDAYNSKVQCMLGELRTGCGDASEIFRAIAEISDGDDISWFTQ